MTRNKLSVSNASMYLLEGSPHAHNQPPPFRNGPINSSHLKHDTKGPSPSHESRRILHLHDTYFLFLAIGGISPDFGEREISQRKTSQTTTLRHPRHGLRTKTMPCAMEHALYRLPTLKMYRLELVL